MRRPRPRQPMRGARNARAASQRSGSAPRAPRAPVAVRHCWPSRHGRDWRDARGRSAGHPRRRRSTGRRMPPHGRAHRRSLGRSRTGRSWASESSARALERGSGPCGVASCGLGRRTLVAARHRRPADRERDSDPYGGQEEQNPARLVLGRGALRHDCHEIETPDVRDGSPVARNASGLPRVVPTGTGRYRSRASRSSSA